MSSVLDFVFCIAAGTREVIPQDATDGTGAPLKVVCNTWSDNDAWAVVKHRDFMLCVRRRDGSVLFEDRVLFEEDHFETWTVIRSQERHFEVLVCPENDEYGPQVTGARIYLDRHPAAIAWARDVEQRNLQRQVENMRIQ